MIAKCKIIFYIRALTNLNFLNNNTVYEFYIKKYNIDKKINKLVIDSVYLITLYISFATIYFCCIETEH